MKILILFLLLINFNFQISSLITKQYVSNVNETELLIKKNNLNRIISKYCATLPGCGIPPADQIQVMIDLVVAAVRGDHVFCRTGFNVLSCGQDNLPGIFLSFTT